MPHSSHPLPPPLTPLSSPHPSMIDAKVVWGSLFSDVSQVDAIVGVVVVGRSLKGFVPKMFQMARSPKLWLGF